MQRNKKMHAKWVEMGGNDEERILTATDCTGGKEKSRRAGISSGGTGGFLLAGAGRAGTSDLSGSRCAGLSGGARPRDQVPGPVDGRSGTYPCQSRLPCAVQQRHRPL